MTGSNKPIATAGGGGAPPSGRVLVFQPALPSYRLDFFERVARDLGEGFSVRYSRGNMGVLTAGDRQPSWAHQLPAMRRVSRGLDWQPGVLSVPLRRGDIVVVSGAPRSLSNMLMLAWARVRGARTIWWGQYWSATTTPRNFRLRLRLMRLADAVIFYTDKEVAEYRAGPGQSDRRLVTALNNGIDVSPMAALRRPFDPAERDNAILFIGRVTEKAKLDLLLRAMADSRLAETVLHVIGDGDGRFALKDLAAELGVAGRVVWHEGTTDETVIAAIANRCRLFVYPGSVGLSLIHAMAYGLPAIVHDDRWRHMPEIAAFEAGKTGLTFHPGDATGLASAIAEGVSGFGQLQRWSEVCLEQALGTYNTRTMAGRFVDCVRRVAAR